MVNQNKTHKQEVSISWECFSSPPDRTRAHRSPMICSSRGSASNTAGNWPIHCLATQQDRKYVYYQQEEQDNQFCQSHPTRSCAWRPYSPDEVADLCPPQSSLVWRTILISERKSQGSEHTVQNSALNTGRDIYFKSALLTRSAKQSHACFLIWLTNKDMWVVAVHRWDRSTAPSDSEGYRVRSFWANIWDGTTQLCIIRVMWTSWDPLGLESFPSESATNTRRHISHKED